ncbi:MAG TPA: diaminopimelate decarboxylase [Actinomycetota bacterium]|nr:diaminopimelate decarboxylase [Actinomycetota bacterium]
MTWDRFRSVLPATARVNGRGRLEIGGRDCRELVEDFGSPLFVMDETEALDRLQAYTRAFGEGCVHYAAKAFLTAPFASLVASAGAGMDCASGGELYTALAGGFPAGRIVLHGNNKSEDELRQGVDSGVGTVVADSVDDIVRLSRIAGDSPVKVLIRVTPGIEAHTHEYLQTGVEDTKFGIPVGEAALEAARLAAGSPGVELRGIHCHIGSQILTLEPFAETAAIMMRCLARCREETSLDLPDLNIGGGLGIAYEPGEKPPAVEELARVIVDRVTQECGALGAAVPRVLVEPGRSIVGPAMVTLYTAGVVKDLPGIRRYLSVDGGMSDNIRPMLYQAAYTFLSADRPDAPHDTGYAVAGKLCESGDLLTRSAVLPEVRDGELLAVAATGAYGYSMASNYNRLPRPAVVGVRDGKVRTMARRETYEDLVRLEL